jgi:UDP-N-acetylglucosamine 1-carboxyvinyltransferase
MRIRVQGGHALNGTYQPSGNTNAAIALIAASMLAEERVTLRNVPGTLSVETMISTAETLGSHYTRTDDHTLYIQTEQIARRTLTPDIAGSTAAMLFLAPILARRQYVRVEVDYPLNRIRTHLEALRSLGLDVVTVDGALEIRAATWDYQDIMLTQASVTATAMVLMLAVCFGKETLIHNAASEPHVQELARMLELMGAQIQGVGSNVLRVFGADTLKGVDVTVGPDHIEVASVAAISALCGGRVQISGTRRDDMRIIDRIYRRLGIDLDCDDDLVFVPKHGALSVSNREEDVDSSIETAPWPGFPSDLVAVATVVATQARGTSLIHEKLFHNRLIFIDKLKAMGAQIVLCDPHRAIVVGPSPLFAIYMDSPDVRAGLGMLAAALVARGETVIDNAQVLRRNFDGVVSKLKALGAQTTIEEQSGA